MKRHKGHVRPIRATDVRGWIPRRPADSHKGKNGHVLIVAGSRGMSGAAILSSLGALRAGAGLVTTAIVESERAVVASYLPEVLTLALPETFEGTLSDKAFSVLEEYRAKRYISAAAVGPGLSIDASVGDVVRAILKKWNVPLVLDADGLNVVSAKDLEGLSNLVITPHPGEFSRLLGVTTERIHDDRIGVARKAAEEGSWVCVLKGQGTVISDGRQTGVNTTGNQAMAAGGMGDVLAGMIATFLAQGLTTFNAACAGVYLHGSAGDIARVSDRGMLASELAAAIPQALKKIGVTL